MLDTIRIANVKTLFELRKTKPHAARVCHGRLFLYREKFGLCDASGILWPVFLGSGVPSYEVGQILTFLGNFVYTPPQSNSGGVYEDRYDDLCYVLYVDKVYQSVPCLEEWKNSVLPNPLPNLDKFLLKDDYYTCYYKSETKKRFQLIAARAKAHVRVKEFFRNRNFTFIESPTLVPSGGCETYLNSFEATYVDYRDKSISLQLPTSPEFALKKILTEMTPKIVQLSRSFRNRGELSAWHEPEFFMLEWYRLGAGLKDILQDTQNLVCTLATFLGSSLELPKHWPRFRVSELFLDLLNLNLENLQNTKEFYQSAKPLSLSLVPTDSWDDIFCKLFMEKIEPFLKEQKACFVTHYPIQMAALAARAEDSPYFAQRAEAFLYGVEICNAYLELVDAKELTSRIEGVKIKRPDILNDVMFENAMNFGLPPCAGNALGLDRVIGLLLGESKISHLYPLPFLSQFAKGVIAEE